MSKLLNKLNKINLNGSNELLQSIDAQQASLIFENLDLEQKTVVILNSTSGIFAIASIFSDASFTCLLTDNNKQTLTKNATNYN